ARARPRHSRRARHHRRHEPAERDRPHRHPVGLGAPRDPDVIGRRTRAGGFRRFYLYSALSIAVLAAALGIGALLNAVLRAAGVGTALGAADLSRTISLTIAVLAFALPVGGVHLW